MDYVAEAAKVVEDVMPWDLEEEMEGGATAADSGYSRTLWVWLKIGLRGWNDYEIPLVRQDGEDPVIEANADKYFTPQVREDQFKPKET